MQISLTDQQEEWVQRQIETGRDANTSEVMRHALEVLQQAEETQAEHILRLRDAVRQGTDEIDRNEFSGLGVQEIIAAGKHRAGWAGLDRREAPVHSEDPH